MFDLQIIIHTVLNQLNTVPVHLSNSVARVVSVNNKKRIEVLFHFLRSLSLSRSLSPNTCNRAIGAKILMFTNTMSLI
jgi:hypothetical protein